MIVKASAYGVLRLKLKLQLQMIKLVNYGNLQIAKNLLKIILSVFSQCFAKNVS